MTEKCVRIWVSGKVQGVGFRRAVQERALQENVTGEARNLADGRVEVLLCGDSGKVNALIQWLWQGPSAARVSNVEVQDERWRDRDNFVTY